MKEKICLNIQAGSRSLGTQLQGAGALTPLASASRSRQVLLPCVPKVTFQQY